MQRHLRWIFAILLVGALTNHAAPTAYSDTILKLHLDAGAGENFEFDSGVLSVLDDGESSSPGVRNATIEFSNPAGPVAFSFGPPSESSFTLTGMFANSPSSVLGGALVVQSFDLGNLAIYGTSGNLLLSGDLSLSAITGPIGTPSAEGLFLAFGQITGGSMASGFDPNSLRVRMKLPTVNGGFSVSPLPDPAPPELALLNSFTATTPTIEILATQVPEPAALVSLGVGGALLAAMRRHRHTAR